jgi:hypothetical protein
MSEIRQNLASTAKRYGRHARLNYFAVWVLYAFSIGASASATILAASKSEQTSILAVLAGTPAVVITIANSFKFNARAQWHYEKTRRLTSLLRLATAGAQATTDPEVAEKWNRIDEEMDRLWPGWGELSTPPKHAQG